MIEMLRDRRRRRLLRLLHRNGGVVLSLFLALFAISGVLLNHTDDIGLDKASVPALIASRYYDTQTVYGFAAGNEIFYRLADTLFMGRNAVDVCVEDLSGAVSVSEGYVALCGDSLVMLTEEGALIERLGTSHGVPPGATAMAASDGRLVMRLPDQIVVFDPIALTQTPIDQPVSFAAAVEVPISILMTESVSWEQFIRDLHSGQFLGNGGVWLADFVALLLVLLGLSGLVMFLQSK